MRPSHCLALFATLASTSLFAQNFVSTPGHTPSARSHGDIASVRTDAGVMPHMSIRSGILTIDGLVVKARINNEIRDAHFFYFSVPGLGTALVSTKPFVGATEQPAAFHNDALTFDVAGHTIELSSEGTILSHGSASAYVMLDQNFTAQNRWPAMGFGTAVDAPYAWPVLNSGDSAVSHGGVAAPALPKVMVAPVSVQTSSMAEPAKLARR